MIGVLAGMIGVAAVAFVAGYLVRRWHRPVGYVPPRGAETRLILAGGQPYWSLSVTSQPPLSTDALQVIVQTLDRRDRVISL